MLIFQHNDGGSPAAEFDVDVGNDAIGGSGSPLCSLAARLDPIFDSAHVVQLIAFAFD